MIANALRQPIAPPSQVPSGTPSDSAIGVPTITAAYAAVPRESLPMATTALNIVQRLGGPVLTTLCTTLVAWRLAGVSALPSGAHAPAYAWGFAMLAAMYALLFVGAMNLPARSEDAAKPAAR